jgi:hypothetical protein
MSLPVFEAAPGMPLHLVARASTVALPTIDPSRRSAYLQPREPHAFTLRCDDDTIVAIGDSRFSVVRLQHGTANQIFTTAVVDYLNRDAALDEAAEVIQRLEAAGFAPKEHLERADCAALASEHEHVRISEHTAPFGSGAWRAEVWLRTVIRRGTLEAQSRGIRDDQCLVNVVIADETLRGAP